MLSTKDLFSKKQVQSSTIAKDVSVQQQNHIEEMKRISRIIDDGVSEQSYTALNKELATMVGNNEQNQFIFPHPSIMWQIILALSCFALSIAFVYTAFIGAVTIAFSGEYRFEGVGIVTVSALLFLLNIQIMAHNIVELRFKKRFDIYKDVLGYKSFEFIKELSKTTNYSEKIVISDLKKSVDSKLIPQGHFTSEHMVFMISDSSYEKYLEKPAVYDQYFKKELEERARVKYRTKQVESILSAGDYYIQKLRGYSELIKNKVISRTLVKMENVISMIYQEIDVNPDCIKSVSIFLNYYLPTTEKLLDAYVELCEKGQSKAIAHTKKEIEDTLQMLMAVYGQILEQLYTDQENIISAEIEALELTVQQEGFTV